MGRGYSGFFNNTYGANEEFNRDDDNKSNNTLLKNLLIDVKLIQELKDNNIKFTEEDVLFITKDKTGQTIWLEKGTECAGFEHIKLRHKEDFFHAFNFKESELCESLYKIVKYGEIVDNQIEIRNNIPSITRVYNYEGDYYLLTGIGTNGFIVSARPQKKEK